MSALDAAHEKGRAAAKAGLGPESCPYQDKRKDNGRLTFSRAFRNAWYAGWKQETNARRNDMTDTRHTQPHCPICRWPYRPDGCTPAQCRNPEPDDESAEFQPKGLQALTLTEPVWVGPWTCHDSQCWERTMLKPHRAMPYTHNASVLQTIDGKWRYDAGHDRHGNPITRLGIETLEAAQAACEVAIVAAWRNR